MAQKILEDYSNYGDLVWKIVSSSFPHGSLSRRRLARFAYHLAYPTGCVSLAGRPHPSPDPSPSGTPRHSTSRMSLKILRVEAMNLPVLISCGPERPLKSWKIWWRSSLSSPPSFHDQKPLKSNRIAHMEPSKPAAKNDVQSHCISVFLYICMYVYIYIYVCVYLCMCIRMCICVYIYIYDMIWYDMIWYDMIWYDMIWYDMIWYDMIWYDMICVCARLGKQ